MYFTLLCIHSAFRWFVLLGLLTAVYRGVKGWTLKLPFSRLDNSIRHITATIAHIQLAMGYVLYFQSPMVTYFRTHYPEAVKQWPFFFFGLLHISLMTFAIIVITITSSAAKRKQGDTARFKVMTIGFALGLLIILAAVPWPFSPLAQRPLIRPF